MVIELYGMRISNYYNVVKLALLEKGLEFVEKFVDPREKSDDLFRGSPIGKIPFIKVGDTYISESQAIIKYLDLVKPIPRLFPIDPIKAARAQQIYLYLDLYIDQPIRRLITAAFFGEPLPSQVLYEVKLSLKQAINALSELVLFDPFIAGEELTPADFAAVLHFDLGDQAMLKLGHPKPSKSLPGFSDYRDEILNRTSFLKILNERDWALMGNRTNTDWTTKLY